VPEKTVIGVGEFSCCCACPLGLWCVGYRPNRVVQCARCRRVTLFWGEGFDRQMTQLTQVVLFSCPSAQGISWCDFDCNYILSRPAG
jgi:hypothetical protein